MVDLPRSLQTPSCWGHTTYARRDTYVRCPRPSCPTQAVRPTTHPPWLAIIRAGTTPAPHAPAPATSKAAAAVLLLLAPPVAAAASAVRQAVKHAASTLRAATTTATTPAAQERQAAQDMQHRRDRQGVPSQGHRQQEEQGGLMFRDGLSLHC